MAIVPINVYPQYSPRLIVIPSPSVEITIQDLHDTLRDWEDKHADLGYDFLISSTGKEDLGGGVTVGITSQLNNAQIMFDPRGEYDKLGIIDTTNTDGVLLIDSTATFITDGFKRGDWVVNRTDNSASTIVSVESETQIRVLPLEGGSDNQFQVADEYLIWKSVKGAVTGGNLVAVDPDGNSIEAVVSSAAVFATLTTASSATIQETQELRDLTYNGAVSIDTISGVSGTTFPVGNLSNPVNNLADALAIATSLGFREFIVRGAIALQTSYIGYKFSGQGGNRAYSIDLNGQVVTDCAFENLTITGDQGAGGVADFTFCDLNSVTNLNCHAVQCALAGTLSLSGGSNATFAFCNSNIPGTGTPVIDWQNAANTQVQFRAYTGGLEFVNMSNVSNVSSVDMLSGHMKLAASVSDGVRVLRGVGHFTNNSTGGTDVTTGFVTPGGLSTEQDKRLREMWQLMGLDSANPMEVRDNVREVLGVFQLTIDEDPVTGDITITRVP